MLENARYRILRRLGAGAAGGVYLVEDRALAGPPLALKRVEAGSDPSFRESLAREFAVLASLSLPRVAPVYDLGFVPAADGLPEGTYFTRAYVDGAPLGEYVRGRSLAELIGIFASTLRTVSLLHRAGVVHGDIKPGNIIVDDEGAPHLIDFGLSSRISEAHGLAGSGTPLYMAPELLRGGVPSVPSDIYALGATFWALLTGRPPHEELGARALSAKLAGDEPEAPANLADDRRELLELARWALASERSERAPSADEVLARLEQQSGVRAANPSPQLSTGLFASPRTRGRELPLAELAALCEQERGQIALITGPSGVGKSAVLRELKWCLQLSRTPVIEVRGGSDLAPFRQLLRQLAVLAGSAAEHVAQLGSEVDAGGLDRAQLVSRVSDALSSCSETAPLVLIIDDLDEAEPLLSEALRMAVHSERAPTLIVIASASRPQQRSVLDLSAATVLTLEPLPDEVSEELCGELLGPLDTAARDALLQRASGNPGVLVEAAALLRDKRGITKADVEQLRVGAVGERLARAHAATLDGTERALLEALAVAGRPLPEPLLAELIGAPLDSAIASLQQRGLARRDLGYMASDDLAFCAWLRGDLGSAAAIGLAQRMLGLPRAAQLDVITRAELAVVGAMAGLVAELALPAALLLQKLGALAAATRLLEAALQVVDTTVAPRARLALAELYGEGGESARALEQASWLLEQTGIEPQDRLRARICAATSLVSIGKLDRAAELLEVLEDGASGSERAKAARVHARVLLRRGDHEKTRRVVAEGVSAAPEGDPSLPELLAIDAYLLALSGQSAAAEALYERALGKAQEADRQRDAAQVLGYRALGYEREGNFERARTEYERCLQAARAAGDVGLTATYASNQGNVSYRTGHMAQAEQSFELAARLSRRAGRTSTALLANNNLADVQLYLGSYARAQQLAQATLAEARELGIEVVEAQATHILSNVGGRTGQLDKALSDYERAASLYRKLGRPREAAEVLLDAAEVLLDRGGVSDVSLASARLASARELIEQQRIDDFRPRLKLLVALVRAKNGELEAALAEFEALEAQVDVAHNRELRWQLLIAEAALYQKLGSDVLCSKKAREAAELLEAMAARISRDARDAFRADPRRRRVFDLARSVSAERTSRTQHTTSSELDARMGRLLELLKRLARERDEARLLERITDAAVELSGAERGFVLLVDAQGQLAPHTVREGRGVEQDPHVAFSRSIAEAVLIDGEPIITVNARDDARVNDFMSVHKLLLKSVACIPINGPRGVLGVLYLEHRMRAGRFRDNDVDLLLAFADQAAIALENAALWSENERSKAALEDKNKELSRAKEDIERLLEARTEELEQAKIMLTKARAELEQRYQRHGIIGQSQAMRRVFAMIERVADSNIPVVVQGESGTGKELVARAVHFAGNRKKAPFVAVNCAAVPDQLLESELFGHVRGAFTGADRDRKGVFAQANGGTLFLDEFADMSPRMQIDLLRVLQEGKIRPVGSEHDLPVDVRVIVASNRPLDKLVADRALREDLYYRLSVVELRLPPLRERLDDLPLLCQHFLGRIAEQKKERPLSISRDAVERIAQCGLPGNVRQLEHMLTSAAMMVEGTTIEAHDLPLEARDSDVPDSMPPAANDQEPAELLHPADLQGFKVREKQRILAALDKHAWNRAKAAIALGMPRRTFYRRLSEFGIL